MFTFLAMRHEGDHRALKKAVEKHIKAWGLKHLTK